jgi:hypothetical protein
MKQEEKRKAGLLIGVAGISVMLIAIVLLVQSISRNKAAGEKSSIVFPISLLPLGIALSTVGGLLSSGKPKN